MSASRRVAISIILAGLALGVGSIIWLATRKLVALDIPVSLSRGHIRTEEFNINLDSGYFIEIEVEKVPSLADLECLLWGCYEKPAILRAQWAVSSAGRVEVSGNSDDINGESGIWGVVGRKVGYFRSSGGQHRLDVDVLSDTSVLDKGNPRLRVEADWEGYKSLSRVREGLPVVVVMLMAVGGVLLLLSRSKEHASPFALGIASIPRIAYVSAGPHRRLPLKPLFSGLPSFGLIHAFILTVIAASTYLYVEALWQPSRGIWVLTSGQSLAKARVDDPWFKPLVLRIDKQNRWFLNDQPVSPEGFSGALKDALSRRPEWFVYLDADPELDFGVHALAIDLIQGLHSKTILVTPNARNELLHLSRQPRIPKGK